MHASKIPVVFFGTGPVASSSLKSLAKNFEIELVITKPKPVHHRGDWPVADLANKLNLPINYVSTKTDIEKTLRSSNLKSQVGIVIDFGLIISSKSIAIFRFGIINSHFSLLPRWRGADPITFSIISGDKETGVSLMKINSNMDEGPLIAQQRIVIEPKTNSVQLTKKLVQLSNSMLVSYLGKYLDGELKPIAQSTDKITYSKKITKNDGLIDWRQNADIIERKIRAYWEWPRSRTNIGGIDLIISQVEVVNQSGKAGRFVINKRDLIVFCGQSALKITKLQPAGKKIMSADQFIRGYGPKLKTFN